jgi:hypothetical protein
VKKKENNATYRELLHALCMMDTEWFHVFQEVYLRNIQRHLQWSLSKRDTWCRWVFRLDWLMLQKYKILGMNWVFDLEIIIQKKIVVSYSMIKAGVGNINMTLPLYVKS